MKLQKLLSVLEAFAPLELAESWDNVGLLVGDADSRFGGRALLCIDLTEAVLAEAIEQKVSLILSYHPPIFDPLTRVTAATVKQRIILKAIEHRIAIYSPHTALDSVEGGVNDWLCTGLGSGTVEAIVPAETRGQGDYKLVTFVPLAQAQTLRLALSQAGAGQIGQYDQCSFVSEGTGTFYGNPSTQPAVGQAGRLEEVPELRLEMLVPGNCLSNVVGALREVHPYEEPAFDLFRRASVPALGVAGQGRILELDRPMALATVLTRIKKHLKVKSLEVSIPKKNRKKIKRIGLCAGSGASLLPKAREIDLFLTGEMRHHDMLDAVSRGLGVVLAGHTQTERPYLPTLRKQLKKRGPREVTWLISRADRAPTQVKVF